MAFVLFLALGPSCGTRSNPAATCADGVCSDPVFPFCDVTGEIGGAAGTCIAVTCDAGSIGGCEGSDKLVCSATGTTYVTKACANGCDPIAGCLECAPNQSVCTTDGNFETCDGTGGATTTVCAQACDGALGCVACEPSTVACTADGSAVQTCDGSGKVASTDACSTGCGSDGGAHCAKLVPSNGLQAYFDMVPSPIDLSFVNGQLAIGSDSASFASPIGAPSFPVTVFHVPAPTGGAPIAVIVGRKITLGHISVVNADLQINEGVGPAVAFLATEELEVSGSVLLQTGGVNLSGCKGGFPVFTAVGTSNRHGGGGGGGNATDGASGGSVVSSAAGGTAGHAVGNDELVPLKGGCPGAFAPPTAGGGGGGAIQLVSLTAIRINASIVADGNVSIASGLTGCGGGAGGGILVEAPSVTLDVAAALLARGGGGYSGDETDPIAPADGSTIPGGVCSTSTACGNGGNGGTTTVAAGVGNNVGVSANNFIVAGGGGGGVGRIRINTLDGSFAKASTAIIAGRLTAGVAPLR